jgi:hypothetical protein
MVNGVLQLVLIATNPRSDSMPGGVSNNVIVRCFEGQPLVPTEDPGPGEDLCDSPKFHPPWTRDFLDPVSRRRW